MAAEPQPPAVPPVPGGEPPRRARWLTLVLPLILLLGVVGGLSYGLSSGSNNPTLPAGARQSAAGKGFFGTLALPAKSAPPIRLRNYLGQSITLSEYRRSEERR